MSLRATNEEAVQSWTTRKKIREKETVFDPRKDSLITKTSGNIERSEEKAKRDAAVETLTVRDREGWGRGEREASVVQRPTCLSRWNFPRGHGDLLKHLWACLAWPLSLHGASELFAPQSLLPHPNIKSQSHLIILSQPMVYLIDTILWLPFQPLLLLLQLLLISYLF